jgi:hypothetical protein
MQKMSAENQYEKAQRLEFIQAVKRLARESAWSMDRAFEELACSCRPQREELDSLMQQRRARIDAATRRFDRKFASRIAELRREIDEIDSREHPELNRTGAQAARFFALWMLDEIRLGRTDFITQDPSHNRRDFAAAWLGGWRPGIPESTA